MANDAHVTLYGTVLQDPTNRQTSNNSTMFNIKLAVQTTKQKEGDKYPQSDIYDVVVFGKPAEYLIGKVKAKTKLLVIGEQQMGDPWTDRNGVTHISPRVNSSNVKILAGGSWNNNNSAQQPAQTNTDDVPF